MKPAAAGMTLFEVVVAATLGSLIAAGALSAYLTAARISRKAIVDAPYLAVQTLEEFRNRIACDDPWFEKSPGSPDPNCDPSGLPSGSWISLPLPPQGTATDRWYQINKADCDGVGGSNTLKWDCLEMQVKVVWP